MFSTWTRKFHLRNNSCGGGRTVFAMLQRRLNRNAALWYNPGVGFEMIGFSTIDLDKAVGGLAMPRFVMDVPGAKRKLPI